MKEQRPIEINEKTVIPISLLIVIIGGVSWLTSLHGKVSASEKQIEEINSNKPESLRTEIKKLGIEIARLQGAVGLKPKDSE